MSKDLAILDLITRSNGVRRDPPMDGIQVVGGFLCAGIPIEDYGLRVLRRLVRPPSLAKDEFCDYMMETDGTFIPTSSAHYYPRGWYH